MAAVLLTQVPPVGLGYVEIEWNFPVHWAHSEKKNKKWPIKASGVKECNQNAPFEMFPLGPPSSSASLFSFRLALVRQEARAKRRKKKCARPMMMKDGAEGRTISSP